MGAYSFLDVLCTINGPGGTINLGSGAAVADEGISFEMTEDKNTMTTGADGAVMHSLHAAKSGTITVRLLKTSPTNAKLSQLYDTQTSSATLHGQNIITLTDNSRGDRGSARQVAFKKFPMTTWAKDANVNEWAFDAGLIDQKLGAGL